MANRRIEVQYDLEAGADVLAWFGAGVRTGREAQEKAEAAALAAAPPAGNG